MEICASSDVIDRIALRLTWYEPFRHAAGRMPGLLSEFERKNCWMIAEHRGRRNPRGLRHPLSRVKCLPNTVREDLRTYVVAHLGDATSPISNGTRSQLSEMARHGPAFGKTNTITG